MNATSEEIANQKSQSKIVEETEGLEPSTLSFEARCSDSVELRLRKKVVNGERLVMNEERRIGSSLTTHR